LDTPFGGGKDSSPNRAVGSLEKDRRESFERERRGLSPPLEGSYLSRKGTWRSHTLSPVRAEFTQRRPGYSQGESSSSKEGEKSQKDPRGKINRKGNRGPWLLNREKRSLSRKKGSAVRREERRVAGSNMGF